MMLWQWKAVVDVGRNFRHNGNRAAYFFTFCEFYLLLNSPASKKSSFLSGQKTINDFRWADQKNRYKVKENALY